MPQSTRVVAYYRVPSGARARTARLSLRELTTETSAFARERRLVVLEPFVESPRRRGRPELERALARCHEAKAALLVPRLAAVGSDAPFLDALLDARVRLWAADTGTVSRRTLELLREVTRHVHAEASARSRAALRAARERGVRLGSPRPEVGSRAGVAALRAQAAADAERIAPALAELLLSNPTASLRDLATALDALGEATPRRGHWGPSAVRNALQRSGLGKLRATR